MNKLIYCITTVNKDVFGGIKEIVVGIPSIFTMGFYERNRVGLLALAAVIGMIVGLIGVMVLGVYIAHTYFPDNGNAILWLPMVLVWVVFFTILYIVALFRKCKEL